MPRSRTEMVAVPPRAPSFRSSTQRMSAEEATRESEERFRLSIDEVPIGTALVSIDTDRELALQLARGEIPRCQPEKRCIRKDGAVVDVSLRVLGELVAHPASANSPALGRPAPPDRAASPYACASPCIKDRLGDGPVRGNRIAKVVAPSTERTSSVPLLASTICLAM